MARILILGVKVPFTDGGQDALVRSLSNEIRRRGHQVDTVELPFSLNKKEDILLQIAMWRSLDLSSFGGMPVDLVIATKFPSYFARHPKKSVWLVHQYREMYDLYGTRFSDFSDDLRDEAIREAVIQGDSLALGECAYRGAISKNVANRLKLYNGLDAEALYPPIPLGNRYKQGDFGKYILCVGRICSIKRVDMILKAMPFIHRDIKLKIVGMPDVSGIMEYLNNEIDKHHLWDRVEFLGRSSDEDLINLYAGALAVYYAPHNEDYGYVTLEAMASGKGVITANDSGGVLEFITDGHNGLVTDPNSEAIGMAINKLVEDPTLAKKLGEVGRNKLESLGLIDSGWSPVVDGLLSPLEDQDIKDRVA